MPHPNLVPVMPSTSRRVQRSRVSSGTSTVTDFPFTLSVVLISAQLSQTMVIEAMDEKVSDEKAAVFQIPAGLAECSGVCGILSKVAKTRSFDKDACWRSCYFGRPLFWDCTMAKRE